MTDSGSIIGPLTKAERRRAEFRAFTNDEFESLRGIMSDWGYAKAQYRKCGNCEGYGDEEYDGIWIDTGVWWCADCISTLVKERLDEDEPGVAAMRDLGDKLLGVKR